jgi:hypothetical protein
MFDESICYEFRLGGKWSYPGSLSIGLTRTISSKLAEMRPSPISPFATPVRSAALRFWLLELALQAFDDDLKANDRLQHIFDLAGGSIVYVPRIWPAGFMSTR